MNATQTNHAPGASHARGDDGNLLSDALQASANWLHIANSSRDYDRAKHAYELARRSYEIAVRGMNTQTSRELAEMLRDLGVRLDEFQLDLDAYSCWSERPVH